MSDGVFERANQHHGAEGSLVHRSRTAGSHAHAEAVHQ